VLPGVAAPTSQVAAMSLQSWLWLHRHMSARPRWYQHRCPKGSRNAQARAELVCRATAAPARLPTKKKAARCEAAQWPIQGGMPDERATVTRERYRNPNVIAGCIQPCVKYFTHGWPHVGVRQLLTGNRSNKGISMNSNSEENKDHVELTERAHSSG
jgi:hypothetical protein